MLTKPALPLSHPASLIATWFGSGLMRPAPGTWGSAAALPFGAGLMILGPGYLLVGIVLVTAAGVWASDVYGQARGISDAGEIVIDEVAGMWIVLLVVPLAIWPVLLAFLLFRLFDIAKPWPAGWCDRKLTGGIGVMADDVVAGIHAAIAAMILNLVGAF